MEFFFGALLIGLLVVFAYQQITRASLIGISKRQVAALEKFDGVSASPSERAGYEYFRARGKPGGGERCRRC